MLAADARIPICRAIVTSKFGKVLSRSAMRTGPASSLSGRAYKLFGHFAVACMPASPRAHVPQVGIINRVSSRGQFHRGGDLVRSAARHLTGAVIGRCSSTTQDYFTSGCWRLLVCSCWRPLRRRDAAAPRGIVGTIRYFNGERRAHARVCYGG